MTPEQKVSTPHAFPVVLNGGGSGLVILVEGGKAKIYHKPSGVGEDHPLTLLGTSPLEHIRAIATDITDQFGAFSLDDPATWTPNHD